MDYGKRHYYDIPCSSSPHHFTTYYFTISLVSQLMMNIFLSYWLPVIAWMVFINPLNRELTAESTSRFLVPLLQWLFPSADQSTIHLLHIAVRKSVHFFNYAFLAILLFRAFRAGRKIWRPNWMIASGIIALAYAGLDEFMQTMVAGRTGSSYDWLIDSAGIVCALGILSIKKGERVNKLTSKKACKRTSY
jgi:VanZ family protein